MTSANSAQTAELVPDVLARIDRHSQQVKLAIVAAVAIEGLLMLIAMWKLDWNDRTHILMFVFAVLGYTIICLGLAALGAHVSTVGMRVVAALDARQV